LNEVNGTKVENQNGSLSCVGQSFAKYAEILEKIETNGFKDLSAKFIYSRIYLPQGGSYLRDAAGVVCDLGVSEESLDPSYPNDEQSMRVKNVKPDVLDNALTYKAKGYASIWHKDNVEIVKQAIYQNKGVVASFYGSDGGWQKALVTPPKPGQSVWGHAVYLIGWDEQNRILFLNSWGEGWGNKGIGILHPDYWTGGYAFSLWTLTDLPDNWRAITQMYKLVKNPENSGEIYAINNGAKRHIANYQTLVLGAKQLDKQWQWQTGQEIPTATSAEWALPTADEIHIDPAD
jgi:hypothetical protein